MNDLGLTIRATQDILGCTESYVYRLIKWADPEVVSHRPTKISVQSVIDRLETWNPFLRNIRTALDYHVREAVNV